jgi:16S rRNA (uracil1498-N3)-methyltransferase
MNFCKLLYYIFMPIFFIDKDAEDREITIEKGDLFHHLNNVLRVHKGEEIRLFSKKFVYEVVVKEKLPDKILLVVKENFAPDFPLPEIFLIQSIIERNSLEEVLQLNIPIFVRNFILFGAKRSNFIITEKNLSRFQKIALSVAEQSEVCFFPEIKVSKNLEEALNVSEENFVIALHPQGKENFKDLIPKFKEFKNTSIVIGPEGGFTEGELQTLERIGIPIASIKTGIFRSDLAGFVASLLVRQLI